MNLIQVYLEARKKMRWSRHRVPMQAIAYQLGKSIDKWPIPHECLPCILCSARKNNLVYHECIAVRQKTTPIKITADIYYPLSYIRHHFCDYHHSSYSNELIHSSLLWNNTAFQLCTIWNIWHSDFNSWLYIIPEECIEDILYLIPTRYEDY